MPGGAEALALVQVDRDGVGAAHLEREARVLVADALVQLGEQRRGEPLRWWSGSTAMFITCQTVS